MPEEKRQIFREQSLDKLSSPDRLDEMLRIVNPPAWILIGTIAVGLALVLVWSVFGRIPAAVNGTAILVKPTQVVGFQSPANGPILEIHVNVGDRVEENALLATLDLPQIRRLHEQEKKKLDHFKARSQKMTTLEKELAEKELLYIERQRENITTRIEEVRKAAERAKVRDKAYIDQQRINVEETRTRIDELQSKLKDRRERWAELVSDGYANPAEELEAQRQQIESELRLAELNVKESEIDLRESLSLEAIDSQNDLVRDLEIQFGALLLRELELTRRLKADEMANEKEIEEIQARIDQLDEQLKTEGSIKSKHAGRVLEVTVTPGQHVSIGQRLGKLEIDDPSKNLQALAYFPIKDGKKLEPGKAMRISPATVERERFGAIRGTVLFVSSYPITTDAAANQIGDVEVARRLLGGQSHIEVLADLDLDPDSPTGFAWTSGDGPEKIAITPGTTAQVRVTIEERAPITLLLPFLKSLSGT